MISTAGINDQELAVIAEISGINDPTITRRADLGICASRDRKSLFDASEAIRRTIFVQFPAHRGERQLSLGFLEGNRGRNAGGIGCRNARRPRWFFALCGLCGACGGLDFALHPVHEILNRLDLLRERLHAGALAFQRFFVLALLALAFVDQGGNAAAILRERRAVLSKRIPLDRDISPYPREFRKIGDDRLLLAA